MSQEIEQSSNYDIPLSELPQFRGAVNTAENQELFKAGIEVAELFSYVPKRKITNKNKNEKMTPHERAEKVALQMKEAGKSPQEIGEVVARILNEVK
jgi:hypothetical protein